MKYLSCFSGIEAATLAWHHLGWEPVGFSEIEPFPCAVLAHRFPNIPNYGDIRKYKEWPIEPGSIDILVGGSPCQAFSVAGLRKGLADPRGNLALTFLGLADHLRPEWIIWENVPGVLSSSGGRDFGSFIAALVELGYSCAWRVLDAQHFGVPQRRRRVFVVATRSGDPRRAAEVLALGEGLRGYLEAGGKKRKATPSYAEESPGAGIRQDACAGRLIQSQKPVVIDRAAFNQGENAKYEPHIEESEVMDPLVARGPHAIGQPICFKIRSGSPVETGEQGGTPGKQAGKGYLGSEEKAFTVVQGQDQWIAQHVYRKAKRAQSTTDDETWVDGQVSNTLNNFNQGETRTTHAVVTHMAVRRLTPVECERLQGFPDNWTRIPWKGKPEEDCPDGPRYKVCGNSMAVPVMRWIGNQINKYHGKA